MNDPFSKVNIRAQFPQCSCGGSGIPNKAGGYSCALCGAVLSGPSTENTKSIKDVPVPACQWNPEAVLNHHLQNTDTSVSDFDVVGAVSSLKKMR